MAGLGPKRQFAAVQRYGRCRWNTGRSADVADAAAPDPNRAPRCFGLGVKIKNSAPMQVHPAAEKRKILSGPKGCVRTFNCLQLLEDIEHQ
jgi:hypothetical protein